MAALEVLAVAVAAALLLVCPPGCAGLHIGQLQVPGPLRNGSVKDVVLDCDYEATKADVGIVIKWFLSQLSDPRAQPTLVYQWIPGRIPQALGPLKERVNLGYRTTDDPSTRHRAINIINPTIELSGEYECHVSSLDGEDRRSKKMVIYVPEDNLELTQSKASDEGQFRLSCEADGVFPRPQLTFIQKQVDSSNATVMEGAEVRVTDRLDGLFDIEGDIVVDANALDDGPEVVLGCELTIPDADIRAIKWEKYESRRRTTTTTSTTTTTQPPREEEVPMESMHSAADGKERNGIPLHAAHAAHAAHIHDVSCMENGTASALKFRSFRLRHKFKERCRFSGAAGGAFASRRLSLLLSASLASSLSAWAWSSRPWPWL